MYIIQQKVIYRLYIISVLNNADISTDLNE